MSLGRADDPEVSAAMTEFLLMRELPQLDPDKIDALTLDRYALYVAQAELAVEERQRQADTLAAKTR